MATGTAELLVVRDGAVATLTLNRPQQRNALSEALIAELRDAFRALAHDDVRVVVLAAAGPAFCAGHDLSELIGRDAADYDALFASCSALMQEIHALPQPVIAKVHALATAAGCQLAAACDLAIAAETARFATPGVKIGLFCTTPMIEVRRAVGPKRAMEMLLTGEAIDAHTAAEWGLVNRVVPADRLDAAVDELAAKVARAHPATVALGKRAFHEVHDYAAASRTMAANAGDAVAQEGMSAFLEKRAPRW